MVFLIRKNQARYEKLFFFDKRVRKRKTIEKIMGKVREGEEFS